MPAYVIVEIEVTDPVQYEAYKKLSPAVVAAYGGRYLARGGKTVTLEGGWDPSRLVILEFDDVEHSTTWWNSPEYAGPKKMRQDSTHSKMVVVEGILPG